MRLRFWPLRSGKATTTSWTAPRWPSQWAGNSVWACCFFLFFFYLDLLSGLHQRRGRHRRLHRDVQNGSQRAEGHLLSGGGEGNAGSQLWQKRKKGDGYFLFLPRLVSLPDHQMAVRVHGLACLRVLLSSRWVGILSRLELWYLKTAPCQWPTGSVRRDKGSTSPWKAWTEAGLTSVSTIMCSQPATDTNCTRCLPGKTTEVCL